MNPYKGHTCIQYNLYIYINSKIKNVCFGIESSSGFTEKCQTQYTRYSELVDSYFR